MARHDVYTDERYDQENFGRRGDHMRRVVAVAGVWAAADG